MTIPETGVELSIKLPDDTLFVVVPIRFDVFPREEHQQAIANSMAVAVESATAAVATKYLQQDLEEL